MLASSFLTGCEKKNGDVQSTSGITTEAPATEAPVISTEEPDPVIPEGAIVLAAKGATSFRVVYPSNLNSVNAEVKAASKIKAALDEFAAGASIGTDALSEGQTYNPDAWEILVGDTACPETQTVRSALTDKEWKVDVVGRKIVICGMTANAAVNAAEEFLIRFYAAAEKIGHNFVFFTESELDLSGVETRAIDTIPAVEGAVFYKYYSSNDDVDEKIYKKGTPAIFEAYVKKLQETGYKIHASHDMNGSLFATLYNRVKTVNVGYYAGDKYMRILIEPYSKNTLFAPESENVYTEVTSACIRMIGVMAPGGDGTGACLIIRMIDGRFIVIDGGHNKAEKMNNIITSLTELSADYLKSGEKPVIAAWIISHPHSDHHGALVGNYSMLLAKKIRVENLMINLMSLEEYNKAKFTYSRSELTNIARGLKAEVIIPHVGNVYYLPGLTMEILFTVESYGPSIPNDENHISIIIKMTFEDPKTGEKTVFMHVGDATGNDFQNISMNFGDYLKSDIMQIAHHGASSKGNNEGTISGYECIVPATILWTANEQAYNSYKGDAQNVVLFKAKTNPNYKECFVAGTIGKTTTLFMPYKVGSAVVK